MSTATKRRVASSHGWLVLIAVMYVAAWDSRHQLKLTQPMSNLRYFYYGSDPDTFSDRALYVLFWPLYALSLQWQDLHGERIEVHWSNRRDPSLLTE